MYARVNMLVGDPAKLGGAIRSLKRTILPDVDAWDGSRGVSCAANADLGTCAFACYWDSLDAMTSSDHFVDVSLAEVVERLRGTVTVEHYEVPIYIRRNRGEEGASVRVIRFDSAPGGIDAGIEEFRTMAVPTLVDMPAFCSAQILTDRTTGRCGVVTMWESLDATSASGSAAAQLSTSVAVVTHMHLRSVEEYGLVFSSIHDGIALEGGVWVTALAGHGYGRELPHGQ